MTEWTVRLEFKPEDLWIGAFWRRRHGRFDLWLCVIPCVPIHFIREAVQG